MNAYRFNVYVSVNAMTPGRRERTWQAVSAVRHVFLDVNEDAEDVVERLATRTDLPEPSCVVHSSPGRLHLLWRVRAFSSEGVERLQKQLARELGADLAATACSQTMRVPGFLNRKHSPAPVVTVEYRAADAVYGPGDFPTPAEPPHRARERPSPPRVSRQAWTPTSWSEPGGIWRRFHRQWRPAWRRPDVPGLLPAGPRLRRCRGLTHSCSAEADQVRNTIQFGVGRIRPGARGLGSGGLASLPCGGRVEEVAGSGQRGDRAMCCRAWSRVRCA